jgi:hypothetical protein
MIFSADSGSAQALPSSTAVRPQAFDLPHLFWPTFVAPCRVHDLPIMLPPVPLVVANGNIRRIVGKKSRGVFWDARSPAASSVRIYGSFRQTRSNGTRQIRAMRFESRSNAATGCYNWGNGRLIDQRGQSFTAHDPLMGDAAGRKRCLPRASTKALAHQAASHLHRTAGIA